MKSATRIAVFAALYLSLGVLLASAQQNSGRLEIAVTSGDTQAQLNTLGQTVFSLYVLNNNGNLTSIPWANMVTTAAELECCNFTVSGTLNQKANKFQITATSGDPNNAWSFIFEGTYQADPSNSNSPTITGTFTATGNAVQYSPEGTFTATFFPDFPATPVEYFGGLANPDGGSDTDPVDVPTILYLGSNSQHGLIGSITTSLKNSQGVSCFVGPLTITPGFTTNGSSAFGVDVYVTASDKTGNQLWLEGYSAAPNGDSAAVGENFLCDNSENCTDSQATQTQGHNDIYNGSNDSLILYYGVSGGPCDGLVGPEASFHLSKKNTHKHHVCHGRGRQ